jgi:cellulose synthase/poly-beta-1,6-N-acetylglucosamine synthase-like glycosyltransferase
MFLFYFFRAMTCIKMMILIPLLLLLLFSQNISTVDQTSLDDQATSINQSPTVMIVLLVRNKAHIIPHSLALLERLDYPKNRISLWIRSDHNEDRSAIILKTWSDKWKKLKEGNDQEDVYHSLDIQVENGMFFKN